MANVRSCSENEKKMLQSKLNATQNNNKKYIEMNPKLPNWPEPAQISYSVSQKHS